jgi:hypothetical protein
MPSLIKKVGVKANRKCNVVLSRKVTVTKRHIINGNGCVLEILVMFAIENV